MSEKLDTKKIADVLMEINTRFKEIVSLVPDKEEKILKHMIAGMIHIALFSRDIAVYCELGKADGIPDLILKKFFEECGCNFNQPEKVN